MPVSEEHALKQIEIEALRQITDALKRLNERSDKQAELLVDVRERLIRIESNKVDSRVEDLERKVDELEADRNRRLGALGAAEWLSRFGPWLVAVFATVAAVIGWDRAS